MRGMKNVFFENYLKIYLSKMITGYQLKPISSYMYSFEVIVDTYYSDPKCHAILMETFEIFYELTLKYLPNFGIFYIILESFEQNIDLAEDFFGLITRVIKVHPILIFESKLLEDLFVLSTSCLSNL